MLVAEAARALIHDVPPMHLAFDGACHQALGVDLPVVVINLARRTDRWQAISERLGAAGLDTLIKAPAVEGAQLPAPLIAKLLGLPAFTDDAPQTHLALTRPAIGCFLSHLSIWRWVLQNDIPRVLVCEDDARPAPGFAPDRFRAFVERLPDEAGLVFPGCLIMAGLAEAPPAHAEMGRLYYFNGTFSYFITPAACRFLIDRIFPLRMHVDHQMSSMFIEHRETFPVYHAAPPFFEPDWALMSDCYVPLSNEGSADQALGAILFGHRDRLIGEGRALYSLNP